MAAAGHREIRSASGQRFTQLLAYYKVRGAPGLLLTEAESSGRINRHQTSHFLSAAYSTQCIKKFGCIPTTLSTAGSTTTRQWTRPRPPRPTAKASAAVARASLFPRPETIVNHEASYDKIQTNSALAWILSSV